jgi:hypothetical protein
MRKDKVMDSGRNNMEPFHPGPVGSVRDIEIASFAYQGETGYGSFWKRFTGLVAGLNHPLIFPIVKSMPYRSMGNRLLPP